MRPHFTTSRICPVCHVPFPAWPYEERRGRQHCSRTCANLARRRPAEERFWAKIQKTDNCWLWPEGKTPGSYGHFTSRTANYNGGAHRFAWQITYGPIPDGLCVCHSCDKDYPIGDTTYRRCVRPEHLFLGTNADNSTDMVAKGRSACGDRNGARKHPEHYTNFLRADLPRAWGVRNVNAKLTDDAVRAIRTADCSQRGTISRLAAKYGVDRHTIGLVRHHKAWLHTSD